MSDQKKCFECESSNVQPRAVKHVEHVGSVRVVDGTGFADVCLDCGAYSLTAEQLAGYERRAAALVLREVPAPTGAMVKYARKALGLRQKDLATLLGAAPETLSRWENDERPIPQAEKLALLGLLEGSLRSPDYVEHALALASGPAKAVPTELVVLEEAC